ncbi:cytochrome-c peroxidase [Sulfuriferula thiophila]|uniref:cytochrome-c peroxidase n=1 Tax=Sulfuriferula thiophila TaxID=1781211 RepID=UPI000F6112B0|nr:cytochrome c peroxidase [Sulfuriferula thiophila]
MNKQQIYTLVSAVILACSVISSGYSADMVTSISKIKLGERLFNDKHLSADGATSCATCHIPEKAFADGLRVAKGISGQLGTRNTPTLLNVNHATSLFWDGRRATLEEQAQDPFINPREQGLKDHEAIVKAVQADTGYQSAFKQVFGASSSVITLAHITQALAAFERSLIAVDAPYDDYVRTHDTHVISESARRGMELFQGRARCVSCHLMEAPVATFTDNQFHSLGIGYRKIEPRLAEITTHLANNRSQPLDHQIISDAEISELGRFAVTLNPRDIAKFRTPSLRNVALTAPYMHDGSIATLEEAVDIEVYYRGIELNRPLILTPQERTDLVTFLQALTSPYVLKKQAP